MNKARYVLLICLLWLPIHGFAQETTPEDSLHSATLIRPMDLIEQNLRWNRASTDLFTSWLSSGLYGYYGPQPTIMVDGIPIDANFFGWQNLNMLPVFVSQVKQTTSLFSPQIYHHTVASAGLVNFKLAPIDSGWSADASYFVGNESGDPGPYMYDSLTTSPNIDRWGPDITASVSYKQNNWYTKGLFSYRKHQPTDLISNLRLHITNSILGTNEEYINHPIFIESQSGLLETGYEASNWNVRARYSLGQSKDYLFLQSFGREIPAKTGYQQFTFEGSYNIGSWLFEGRYMAHLKTIDKRIALHRYIFNWQQWKHTTAVSARYNHKTFRIKSGLIHQRFYTSAWQINDGQDVITTFYLNGKVPFGEESHFYSQNSLDFYKSTIAGTARLGASFQLTERWSIAPETYYSQMLPIRQHSFAFWVGKGYTFADRMSIAFQRAPFVSENKLFALKLRNVLALSSNLNLLLEQQYIHHYKLNIPWQEVDFSANTSTHPSIFTISQESGERFSFMAQLQHTISSTLQQRLSWQLQTTLSGNERYEAYFEQIPASKLSYQLDIRPVPNLLVSLLATYRSSTHWKELAAIDGEEYHMPTGIPIRKFSDTYNTHTPSYFNIDLSLQKWLWDRHLSAQFSINNLLNEEVRMHPMGAKKSTTFNVKIGLHL